MAVLRYLAQLDRARTILWCYLIWYVTVLYFYFEPDPALWLNALGISAVIGIALLLSVSHNGRLPNDRWQIVRLFAMPFCVSSFSSLIKGKGFWLIVPPDGFQLLMAVSACLSFVALTGLAKYFMKQSVEKHHP